MLRRRGAWGPAEAAKIYTVVNGVGISTWTEGSGWAAEVVDGDANGNFNWNNYMAQIWCADDDSIACTNGIGTLGTNDQIWTRPGAPGAGWVLEYTNSSLYYPIIDVHGTPDGSAIFAVAEDATNYYVLQRGGGGSWSVVHTFAIGAQEIKQIHVASPTEVRLFGWDSAGNDGLGAVIFEWGVFLDPTQVGDGAGVSGVDYPAIRRAIGRLSPAHTLGARQPLGTIVRGSSTVSPGTPLAIPDDDD